jgi:hypothetical protein
MMRLPTLTPSASATLSRLESLTRVTRPLFHRVNVDLDIAVSRSSSYKLMPAIATAWRKRHWEMFAVTSPPGQRAR